MVFAETVWRVLTIVNSLFAASWWQWKNQYEKRGEGL